MLLDTNLKEIISLRFHLSKSVRKFLIYHALVVASFMMVGCWDGPEGPPITFLGSNLSTNKKPDLPTTSSDSNLSTKEFKSKIQNLKNNNQERFIEGNKLLHAVATSPSQTNQEKLNLWVKNSLPDIKANSSRWGYEYDHTGITNNLVAIYQSWLTNLTAAQGFQSLDILQVLNLSTIEFAICPT